MTAALLILLLVGQTPGADSLRQLALLSPGTSLVLAIRDRPGAVRDAIGEALRRRELPVAERLATAYAAAWRDSFLVREVARFAAWPDDRRVAKLWADSIRRVGITAFGRDGPRAAITLWGRSAGQSRAIGDTAGLAAALGNIGAGWLEEGRLDSAQTYLAQTRLLALAIGDVRVAANAIGELAGISQARRDFAVARAGYEDALALRERIGDTRGAAADQNNLGLVAEAAGDLDEARRRFELALALNRRDGRDEIAATNLVNLAGLASVAGDFARAEALYRNALATWHARGQSADVADALYGLGQLELRRGDYPAAREVLREAASIYTRTGPLEAAIAVRRELATALAAQGDLQGAVDELGTAQRLADSGGVALASRAGITLARADLAMRLNALGEAERQYARAEFLYRQAGDLHGLAEAQQGRGLLLVEREDFGRAQVALESALRNAIAAGAPRSGALTRLSLAVLPLARGDTTGARRALLRAQAELQRLGDPVASAVALGERATLEAAAGLPVAAESLYRAALAWLAGRVVPDIAAQLHAGLGLTLRAQGFSERAARELRAALTEVERPARSLALPERRAAFLADKWDLYAWLALLEHGRGRPAAAFEISERLHAREMLELLARGRATSDEPAADLVMREQDLRRRIAELTSALESEAAAGSALRGADRASAMGPTREALARAQEDYATLLLEIRERAPRHAALVLPEVAPWRDVARRLAAEDLLIEYLVSDSGSLAFVITRDSLIAVELGAQRRELARLVEFARGTVERRGPASTDSLWRGPLRQLYQWLIAPLEERGLLAGRSRLVVVPHGELHYLPFAALLTPDPRDQFLIERYDIVLTPSASVWLALADRPTRRGAGILAFAPRPAALPGSHREVTAVERVPGASALRGGHASEAAFYREAPSRRVLHLATFGVLNKANPLFSFVDLQAGDGHDGRLEVHEVLGLSLAADLVVLSACQTAMGSGSRADVPPGDDWVGLTRAFLHAGAGHVIATLWPVDDWATAALMERLYAMDVAGRDPVGALAEAQRAALRTFPTSHPFYWAGVVVVGGHSP